MKHSWKITAILLVTFLLAQFIGLLVINNYIDVDKSAEEGKTLFKQLPIGERPDVQEDTSYVFVVIAVTIGTLLALALIKFNLMWVWKIWFLFAVVLSLIISFSAFINVMLASFLALFFG